MHPSSLIPKNLEQFVAQNAWRMAMLRGTLRLNSLPKRPCSIKVTYSQVLLSVASRKEVKEYVDDLLS